MTETTIESLTDLLEQHQREPNSTASCTCGWWDLYPVPRDHSEHVAEVIATALGLVLQVGA